LKLTQKLAEARNVLNELRSKEEEDIRTQEELEHYKNIEVMEKKGFIESNNTTRKQKEGLKKEIAKIEKEIGDIDDQIKQKKTEYNTMYKNLEELNIEIGKQEEIKENLDDEIKLFTAKVTNKDIATGKIKMALENHKKEILQYETELVSHKSEESVNNENIKKLTAMKEKMARTAAQANQQAKDRREELKILRLTILDLSKRHQETKFKLDSFVTMYENVKNERNKYVTMIQNCSHMVMGQFDTLTLFNFKYHGD
jgi:chromosome segregation ATPase